MSKTTIPRGGITADAIDATLIADDAISEEHLDATAITGHTALAETPADTDEFLISDGGTLKRLDASYVGGGAWTLLETESTASGSAAIFTSMSSTYHTHVFVFETVRTATDDDTIRLMVQNSSGDTEQVYGGLGSGANEGFSGFLYFTGTQDANDATLFHGTTINFDHNNKYTRFLHHGRISNSVLPNIRFYGGSGNFEHGNIYLYGIK